MTIEELRTLMEDTLTPLGLEVGNVEVSPHLIEKTLEIWSHSGCHYYVSPSFLELPEAEARFAILHEVGPEPTPHLNEAFWKKVQTSLLIVFLISILVAPQYDSILAAMVLSVQIPRTRLQKKGKAEQLEGNVRISRDPIAARTYLEKKEGSIFHPKLLAPKSWFRQHPIRNYLRYGTDERLKAILRSDLVHPSPGGSAT